MMTPDQREVELRAIRAEQRELRTRLQSLETRIGQYERAPDHEPVVEAPLAPPPLPVLAPEPLPVPPPLPVFAQAAAAEPVPEPVAAAPRESLEMQIGSTWLVRAGVVLVLTSLAFLGSYLYSHIVPILGPAAKVALLYLGAGALTGAGAWLERSRFARENTRLRDYASVVFAGGLAAVYYVTYAAHWNPHLRVVANPLLAGALLLGWAAFMVWIADRRGSELLATFAILLAFYTSAVNEISTFTLVANLFLAVGAVWLLQRQLWRIFPFVSLLATFGSYGFWRFSHAYIDGSALAGDAPPHFTLSSADFWVQSSFLLLYWLLFTWAVFTTVERTLPARRRAGFVTVNNTAFFLLTTFLQMAAYPGSFWKLALGFGAVLLVLAETSRRVSRASDADTENAYLLQGVLLVTLGFIAYFSGWQLSLVLAVQSAVLLWRAGIRESRVLLGAAGAAAGLSAWYAVEHLHDLSVARAWVVGLAEGALLVGNAWWSQRLLDGSRAGTPPEQGRPTPFYEVLPPILSWFAFLGSAVWFWMLERPLTAEVGRAPLLVGAAMLLSASIYVLRVRALPLLAQAFLVAAHVHWLAAYVLQDWNRWQAMPPVWNPLALLVGTLALGHWWQWRRTADGVRRHATPEVAILDAVLAVVLLYFWLRPHRPGPDAGWMAEAALLSLVVLGYGVGTRYRALAAAGQGLLAVSVLHFFNQWNHDWPGAGPERWLALGPLLAILAALAVGRRLLPVQSANAGNLKQAVTLYELLALILFLFWTERYEPRSLQFALLSLAGAGVFALGCWGREKRWQLLSAVPTAVGLLIFFLIEETPERRGWLGLAGAAILAGQQQFGKRWLKDDAPAWFPAPAQAALMTAAVFCAWTFITARMERWEGSAFTLAASWSLFAPLVFAVGLLLHERVYRWLGLLILAATLGHIVLFDISQLDSLGRAISSLALGLVVLGIGFFYNRFQSKFRDLL